MKNKIHIVHGLSSHLLQPSTIDIAFSPVKLPKLFIKKNAEAPSPLNPFPYYRYYNIRLIPFDFFILSHSLFPRLAATCHVVALFSCLKLGHDDIWHLSWHMTGCYISLCPNFQPVLADTSNTAIPVNYYYRLVSVIYSRLGTSKFKVGSCLYNNNKKNYVL